MAYFIGALIVIFVLVEVIRVIIYALSRLASGLVFVSDGIGHGATALAGFLATVTPGIAEAVVAIGLLWAACWLVSEAWYALGDSRAERGWFEEIAPRIKVAMAPGSLYSVAGLGVPPRSPAFGRGADHPLTLPIPRSLQRLVDAGTRAAGRGAAVLPASGPDSSEAAGPLPAPLRTSVAAGVPRRAASPGAPERSETREDLNSLPARTQLDRVRDLVHAGTRVSFAVRAIAEDGAVRDADLADARGRGRLIVEGTDGAQVGVGNRQYNFYTYKVVTPKIENLAARLSDGDVVAATRRLAADPENAAARRALLDRLAPGGLRLGGPTSELHITAVRSRATRSGSWLDGTVLFRHVSNGQIGDGNKQRNEFVYAVAPSGSSRELLAANRDLARALIDCAFPERAHGDVARLGRVFRSALEGSRVEPGDGRTRSAHYDYPSAGRTLRIRAHDGVSVGERSTITRTDRVIARPAYDSPRSAVSRFTAAETARAARAEREAISRRDAIRRDPGMTREGPAIGGMFGL